MLKTLLVKNYALIDALEINFHEGLNIITGETGAGKSILLGALSLILGHRADVNTLKDKSAPCVVEGTFSLDGHNLEKFFDLNDLEYSNVTTIRRHINPAGKSRAFVNELPVTLTILKELVGQIIDIHSQHENLLLADGSFQLSVLDSFAANAGDLIAYSKVFEEYKTLNNEVNELKQKAQQAKADLDYLQFQLNQLTEAKLVPGEDLELETLQKQLAHAEDIKTALNTTSLLLNSEETSTLIWLKEAETTISKIIGFHPLAEILAQRIESARIELNDIAHEIEIQNEKVDLDPNELQVVNQRLDLIFTLQQKHHVSSVNELIALRDKLANQVNEITSYDQTIIEKSTKLESVHNAALKQAKSISQKRVSASQEFEQSIKGLLEQLGMPHAEFKVKFEMLPILKNWGIDKVSFLFSANKQVSLNELAKVASGGELSRLMLSLKSLMVKTTGLPTIILDEIDTGVSGGIADKVGNIINDMAQGMQVINITHLPQIASKGDHHFLVYKEHSNNTTKTLIRRLTPQERITEVAKMLSGEEISDAAIINAKHLLDTE
ncbi:MAG: DNA repair protein RecN [Bacteroidales bacterium]|nr:DNA repair protein RecN [Tenuifilaceae bacterium]